MLKSGISAALRLQDWISRGKGKAFALRRLMKNKWNPPIMIIGGRKPSAFDQKPCIQAVSSVCCLAE